MGFFSRFTGKAEPEQPLKDLKACVSGKVIPLKDVNDGVFSSGMLGAGVAILPEGEIVEAPCEGEVTAVMDGSWHAVGMTLKNGMELIIHVGLDTVEMKGDGFECFVKAGDKVKTGQKLLTFSKEKISAAGYRDIIIMVITNSADYPDIKFYTGMDAAAGETTVAEL